MSAERGSVNPLIQSEAFRGYEQYQIVLGKKFLPFGEEQSLIDVPDGKKSYVVPETYDHYLYLRKWVNLSGVEGFIDIIEEDPEDLINQLEVIASGYKSFHSEPLGSVKKKTVYSSDGFENVDNHSVLLRFAFILKTPGDYTKLLSTYGDVEIGDKRFLLVFNLDKNWIKRGFEKLESGEPYIAIEKNLFDYDELSKLERKYADMDGVEKDGIVKNECEFPGRIAFVYLPQDLEKLKPISVRFERFEFGKEESYPEDPVQPNLSPIPILV